MPVRLLFLSLLWTATISDRSSREHTHGGRDGVAIACSGDRRRKHGIAGFLRGSKDGSWSCAGSPHRNHTTPLNQPLDQLMNERITFIIIQRLKGVSDPCVFPPYYAL